MERRELRFSGVVDQKEMLADEEPIEETVEALLLEERMAVADRVAEMGALPCRGRREHGLEEAKASSIASSSESDDVMARMTA
jgi:hypothetical protein